VGVEGVGGVERAGTILSDEVDNFVRVITIDSEATFFDLHDAILESVNYEKNQMTTFFMC
jgi:hypothetical protein